MKKLIFLFIICLMPVVAFSYSLGVEEENDKTECFYILDKNGRMKGTVCSDGNDTAWLFVDEYSKYYGTGGYQKMLERTIDVFNMTNIERLKMRWGY